MKEKADFKPCLCPQHGCVDCSVDTFVQEKSPGEGVSPCPLAEPCLDRLLGGALSVHGSGSKPGGGSARAAF